MEQTGPAQIRPQSAGDRRPEEFEIGTEFADARGPGMTAATAEWASGNCNAAAVSGTPWLSQTARIASTRALTSDGAGA
jgi:hypothetical protein